MAPTVHPPCTPSASCAPTRCHPTPPSCTNPEKCLIKAINKGSKPCESAVSILSTTAKLKCTQCITGKPTPSNKLKYIRKYLKQKRTETGLIKIDRLTGSNRYADYVRKKNKSRRGKTKAEENPCCQGKGNRGWVHPKKRCVIL